jgi:hypothetical protein
MRSAMSAIGTKRTSLFAPHMSAFGGKADMTFCGECLLLTQSGYCLCTAAMVLMLISAPIKVLV